MIYFHEIRQALSNWNWFTMQKVQVKRCTGWIWAKSHHTPPVPPSQSLKLKKKCERTFTNGQTCLIKQAVWCNSWGPKKKKMKIVCISCWILFASSWMTIEPKQGTINLMFWYFPILNKFYWCLKNTKHCANDAHQRCFS